MATSISVRPRHTRRAALAVVVGTVLGCLQLAWPAFAAGLIEIVQKGRAFAVREVEIAPGDTLRFLNQDEFPHQIYTKGPGVSTDSPLQGPGETIDVGFPTEGDFEVRCGVHPRMRLSVHVR